MPNQKQWWVPVWTGLVMDEKGTHYNRIKSAIWLYLYFLLSADRKTGLLKRKIKTISQDMGIRSSVIRVWLRILKREGYIGSQSTGRCLIIRIKKWKLLERQDFSTQSAKSLTHRVSKSYHSQERLLEEKHQYSSAEIQFPSEANDISIKKDINIDIDRGNNSIAEFMPKSRQDLLAIDLAKELDDVRGLALYLSYSKKYPEALLRRILHDVKAIPDIKIKKSRGALFNHLVQKHIQKAI